VSRPRDTTLLTLAETLSSIDAALTAGDVKPIDDAERDELVTRWTRTIEAMTLIRATSPRGRRSKSIALQMCAVRLSPTPMVFAELALSLAHDLAAPLPRAQAGT
jgi:hypothetical protein